MPKPLRPSAVPQSDRSVSSPSDCDWEIQEIANIRGMHAEQRTKLNLGRFREVLAFQSGRNQATVPDCGTGAPRDSKSKQYSV